MGMPDEAFHVPRRCPRVLSGGRRGGTDRDAWESRLASYDGDRAALEAQLSGTGMPGWDEDLPVYEVGDSVATRKASNAPFRRWSSSFLA